MTNVTEIYHIDRFTMKEERRQMMVRMSDNPIAYVGTYTSGKSEGIYAVNLDIKTGKLEQSGVLAKLDNPSYLALSMNCKYLYTVIEVETYEGKRGGAVGAFLIDHPSGKLKLLNMQLTNGRLPCHITTDCLNKYLFAANYKDGILNTFSINDDGSIGPMISQIRHQGSGPNTSRQENAHTHYVTFTPDEKYLCAVDLGIDKIMVYHFNRDNGSLTLDESRSVSINPGSGPRHMEFHPDGKFAYLINELTSDIVVLEYSSDNFSFRQCQTISALPEGNTVTSFCGAIHISPDGKFLYASNRGHDSIAAFSIDKLSGKLTLIAHTSTYGQFPRDFAIHPSGKYLLVANQNSGTIVPFLIEKECGKLEQIGDKINIPNPVCIKFT